MSCGRRSIVYAYSSFLIAVAIVPSGRCCAVQTICDVTLVSMADEPELGVRASAVCAVQIYVYLPSAGGQFAIKSQIAKARGIRGAKPGDVAGRTKGEH